MHQCVLTGDYSASTATTVDVSSSGRGIDVTARVLCNMEYVNALSLAATPPAGPSTVTTTLLDDQISVLQMTAMSPQCVDSWTRKTAFNAAHMK